MLEHALVHFQNLRVESMYQIICFPSKKGNEIWRVWSGSEELLWVQNWFPKGQRADLSLMCQLLKASLGCSTMFSETNKAEVILLRENMKELWLILPRWPFCSLQTLAPVKDFPLLLNSYTIQFLLGGWVELFFYSRRWLGQEALFL